MSRTVLVLLITLQVVLGATAGVAQDSKQNHKQSGKQRGGSGLGNYEKPPPANDIPDHPFDIILGRPSDSSMTIRVLPYFDGTGAIEYRVDDDTQVRRTASVQCVSEQPIDIVLNSLHQNTRYFYRWVASQKANHQVIQSPEYTFHTQRTKGEAFCFTVTADSHLDENSSGDVYSRTLTNALADQPDFHFELGDTFMTGKYVRPELARGQYLAQRYYLGQLCHSAALFFTLGNHDGESGGRGSMLWASQTRKALFPNPSPDGFYSGNRQREPQVGFPENYYAWEWGDAQFIVLDPYRYTARNRGGRSATNTAGNWNWTLGVEQYQWLKRELEQSRALYRFVFIHHLVGGAVQNNRGGTEVASLWEWGGNDVDGKYDFDRQRPGWNKPIHQLLADNGVSIVFHGHDHLFVKQDLDGIVYQEVPQPSHGRVGNTRTAADYGYLSGEIQGSSGYVRVRVEEQSLRVDYVRTYLPTNSSVNRKNGEVSFSYQVRSR